MIPSAAAGAVLLAGALAAAGVVPVRADEPPPGGGGAVKIVSDPPRLVLVGDVAAELRVTAPADAEELSLTASAGKVDAVRRLPGGGWVARYRPPAERVPQVAIVAAVARGPRGAEDGWVAIPMSGRGTARVRGAPGAPVTLRVGDRTFGPETAGKDGVAAIPVVVPPGVREAHQGFLPIDLNVPETTLIHAVADRGRVHADREEKVRVVAFVVAPHGAARRGDAPVFEPSRGAVTVSEREAGAYVASWTLPPGPAGEDRLVVRLPSATASRTSIRLEAVAGAPAVIAVSSDRGELVAGGEGATVIARALDAAGNPVPAALTLEARGARLEDVAEKRPGEVHARLAPATLLASDEAVVTASAPALGISGARTVPLRAAEPAVARFEPRAVVRGDGARETTLRVTVEDRFGNPVGAAPQVSAARGRVAGVSERSRGDFAVRYVAPAVAAPVEDTLVARVGKLQVTLAPLVAPPAPDARVEVRAGVLGDVRGRFGALAAAVAVERPGDLDAVLRRGLEAALRVEAGALAVRDGPHLAVLAGPALRRAAGGGTAWSGSATVGLLARHGEVDPAARLALSVGSAHGGAEPFLELSVLAGRAGAPGPFAAAGLALGVRLGVEGRHAHDPDRR